MASLGMVSVALASGALTDPGVEPKCGAVAVKANVEVSSEEVTLAELLAPETCPALLRQASRMKLGRAPLVGSDRVLDSGTLRALLGKAAAAAGIRPSSVANVSLPERTTLRRADALAQPYARVRPRATAVVNSTVRPGEAVRLVWDQNGIRSIVPATSLDRGAPGDEVRARIQPGGQVMKATVISAGLVRVVL